MKKFMAITSWIVTVLIAILGVMAGQTIWFYQEPLIDSLPMPPSYTVAVLVGLAALVCSLTLSIVATFALAPDRRAIVVER